LSHSRKNLVQDADWDQLDRFSAFAEERGLTELQVAFSWLAAQPSVASVIAGATRPEQIRENAEAASWQPSAEDLAELDDIFPQTPKVALF
ncbi:MAG: aldo/keto reductase, partial [Sinomonas sp.]|nr:aldo/keto reductase [Sinomonas sp.]